MRIAFFADNFFPELSGIGDSILLTGIELARRNHQIEYFVPAYSNKNYNLVKIIPQELDLGKNIKIHRIASFPFKTPTLQGRLVIPNPLRGFFTEKRFDIIHSHSIFGMGLNGLFISKIKKIPFVGTNHTLIEAFGNYSPIYNQSIEKMLKNYVSWYYNQCNLVSTPSNFLLKDMREKGLKNQAKVISNPIAQSFFDRKSSKENLKKQFGFSPFTILYVGRLSPEKGISVLMEAFINLAKDIPEASLVIVGQGLLRESLEERAHISGLEKRIKFLGPFIGSHKKTLYEIFHAADVFVMPSTSETQSMAVLQAMAAGIPIAAAKAGALPEIVDQKKGLLFTPGNIEEIKTCIKKLKAEKNLRENLIKNEEDFVKKFCVSNIGDMWEKTYNEIAGKALRFSLSRVRSVDMV